jgi:hypothetical protein
LITKYQTQGQSEVTAIATTILDGKMMNRLTKLLSIASIVLGASRLMLASEIMKQLAQGKKTHRQLALCSDICGVAGFACLMLAVCLLAYMRSVKLNINYSMYVFLYVICAFLFLLGI